MNSILCFLNFYGKWDAGTTKEEVNKAGSFLQGTVSWLRKSITKVGSVGADI